jgi:hypothetical protein
VVADEGLIVHPDIVTPDDPGSGDALFCFLNPKRVCGPDCVSFVTYPKRGKDSELNDTQAHCELILAAERASRHVAIIASMMADGQKKQKTKELDEQRSKAAPPIKDPSLFGGNKP